MGNLEFNANLHNPSAPLDAVPSGWYNCRISKTEIKETKNGNGRYLMLTLDIIDGEFKGKKMFDRLNLWNKNQEAVDIANKTLSAICHATGIMQPRNHEEFGGKTLTAKAVKTNDPQYGEGNDIKGYKALEGSASVNSPASADVASSGSATPPWGSR